VSEDQAPERPFWMTPVTYTDDADLAVEGEGQRAASAATRGPVPESAKADPALRDPNIVELPPTKVDTFEVDDDDEL
jgi:hypothetical protein